MSFNFGPLTNPPAWAKARQWLKGGIGVYSNGKPPVDDSQDNNYQDYGDNSASTGAMPTHKHLNSSNQFEINAGHTIIGSALTLGQITPPGSPTAAARGTAGSTSYTYNIVARGGNLSVKAATAVTITTGPATLNSTNYIRISWAPSQGNVQIYDVYRTASAGSPSTTGRIGTHIGAFQTPSPSTETFTFDDTGLTGDSSTIPATNTSGALTGDLNIYGNLNLNALATPAAPLATIVGTVGSTTIAYKIVAYCGSVLNPTGHTVASAATTVTTANATLSSSNYVKLVWQPVIGAITYGVWRTSTNGTSPTTTGFIGYTTTSSGFNDTGIAGDSSSAPVTNTTGVSSLPSSTTFTAAAITDINGNPELLFPATASAINGLTETNSATGNPVTLASSGGDTDVGFTLNAKGAGALTLAPGGATGTVVIGKSDQTGTITLGSSSGTQTVTIANGAGIPTVTLANTSTLGATVTIAGAATATGNTDTINIGTGNTVGTGSKVIHIGDGTPAGTNVITIGSNANTANTTTLKGGSGTGAITLTPQTTGTIVIGAAAGTGNITVGSSSTTQSVLIGNGAGAATVSIAHTGTAGNTVNVAGAATATGNTDTVNIATGNSAGTGAKTVHIADGTPAGTGINTVTIGCVSNLAHVTTIQGGNGAGAITLTPQTTGTIVVGAAAGTGNITIGSSSTTQTVLIGNGAGAATVSIANTGIAGNTVNIASSATATGVTDTVSIGAGNTAGTGSKTINIASGAPAGTGTDTVNIGTGNAASTSFKKINIATGTPNTTGHNWVTIGGGATSSVTVNATATIYQTWNYIATESGSNNAIAGALVDASGTNVTLAAGLKVVVLLGHSLQAGANTFVLNGTSKNIKSHYNPANNIGTAYVSGGIWTGIYDGTQFLDMSQ